MMSPTWLYALIFVVVSSGWWWYRKLRDFLDGFDLTSRQVTSSQNLDSPEPTPAITSNSCPETAEAVSDKDIIRNHPWAAYKSASTSEKEALELAILLEVAKSLNQIPGDHDLAVIQEHYLNLLRNNQDFKVVFLCCWKMGCFQDLRSHDVFLSIQPLSSQPLAVDVDDQGDMFIEGDRAVKHRENTGANSLIAGGQTINIQGSTFNNGGNIKLKQIFYSDNHESKIPEWLSSLEYSETHNSVRQKRTPGTGTWFLNSEEFMNWMNNPDRNVLWCPGIPGAGKTVIGSLVIDHLREHTQDTAVIYIYFTYKLHDQQSLATSIQTLSRQVHEICRRKEIPSDFEKLYISHLKHKTRPSMDELLEALRTTLEHFKNQVYVILDALDEYLKQYSDEEIHQLLITVQSFGNHVKIMATSRNIGDMKNLFGQFNAINKEIVADPKDLEAYLNNEIMALKHLVVSAQLSEQVVKKVEEAANGRFLMAELHMQALKEKITTGDLEESLNSLSSEMDNTYTLAMERIEKLGSELKELAKKTLMWVALARRPLKAGELQYALATKHGRKEIAKFLPPVSTITSACIGLVIIENEKVAFVHFTTQEFFDEHQARYFPEAHKEIGCTCLDYMLIPPLFDFAFHLSKFRYQYWKDLPDSVSFYNYAVINWGFHVNRYGVDQPLAENIVGALKPAGNHLQLASIYTLEQMGTDWMNDDVGLDGAGLFLALYHQQKAAFSALIDKTHIPMTKRQRTPFIIAAYLGLPDFIELMVQAWGVHGSHPKQNLGNSRLPRTEEPDNIGVHVASPDDAGHTPLWYAVDQRHTAVVKLLLQYPATQVNTSHDYGWPPLILAAYRGYEDITELLLKRTMMDINSQDIRGRTVLRIAAGEGFHDLVKSLLEHPAIDVNLADDDGVSPFLAALERGDTSILKLLLAYQKPSKPAGSLQDTVGPDATVRESADESHHPGDPQLPQTQEPDNIPLHVALADIQGDTPLSHAARRGQAAVVEMLLQYPATQVNTSNKLGSTPLMMAASGGFDGVSELLLKCPMLDINAQNHDGETALLIAANNSFHNLVKLLLKHPAIDVNLADHNGVSTFLAASREGDTSTLKLLLDYRKPSQPVGPLQDTVGPLTVNVHARDKSGWSALTFAAWEGRLPAIELLLNCRDIDPLADLQCDKGYSPFARASQQGHVGIVQALLNRAQINANSIDNDGATPLIRAAYNGHALVAKVLLNQPGIQVNLQDGMGRTALSRACDRAMTPNEDGKEKTEADACSFVALLLEHKDTDMGLADEEGKTPLYYATCSGFQEVIKLMQGRGAVYDDTTTELLVKWVMKLDINSQDTHGKTALRVAAGRGCQFLVKLLLEHPAIDVNLADDDGVSPFLAASESGDTSTLKLLLDYRKPSQPVDPLQDTVGPLTVDVNARSKSGWPALALAAWEGRLTVIELLLNCMEINPNQPSSRGCSPLALASEKGQADIVQLLLDCAPVNINNIDNDGATPLICAAYNGHASVAEVLLDQPGIRVNVQDGRGRTALSRACDAAKVIQGEEKTEAEACSFVALLLEHKDIDVNLADEEGKTPSYYASRSGFQKVVELMQRRGGVMISEAESTPTNDRS